MENTKTIKFYRNYKNGRYYISGKNHQDKWFYLNKSKEFNTELYLENEKFAKGVEVDKSLLKVLDDTDNVLVFKNAQDELQYCISKEQIEQNKKERQNKTKTVDAKIETLIADVIKELIDVNGLQYFDDGIISKLIATENAKPTTEELQPIDDKDLPF